MVDLGKTSKKQFLAGMNLALRNARSLVKEAELLAKHKAYTRAFALGVLALEEAGKVVFLTVCSHGNRLEANYKTLSKLWRVYRRHQAKIDFFESWYRSKWKAVLYIRKCKRHNETEENYKRTVVPLLKATGTVYGYLKSLGLSSIAELKLKCLYTDINRQTLDFRLPNRVPPKVASGLILIAKSQIEDAGKLRDTFRRARTDQISEEIIDLMFEPELKQELLRELS